MSWIIGFGLHFLATGNTWKTLVRLSLRPCLSVLELCGPFLLVAILAFLEISLGLDKAITCINRSWKKPWFGGYYIWAIFRYIVHEAIFVVSISTNFLQYRNIALL